MRSAPTLLGRPRRRPIGTVGLLALLAPWQAAIPAQGGGEGPASAGSYGAGNGRVLVAAFESLTEDRSLYWIGEAIADGLAREIRQAGGAVVDRQDRVAVQQEMGVPNLSALTLATQVRIAEENAAAALVTGSYQSSEGLLTIRGRVADIAAGQIGPWTSVSGPIKSLVRLQRDLFAKLRPVLGLPAPRVGHVPTATPEDGVPQTAYEYLIKSYLEDSIEQREKILRRSLAAAPEYLRAKIELAQLYREANEPSRAVETLADLATRDPALAAEGQNLLAEIELDQGRPERAEAALRRSLALRETARAHLLLAKVALTRGDWELARVEAARCRQLEPPGAELLEIEQALALSR